jgi:undecaprenyl-phosphate 4-deoxy-4-formamido-L-arabinose transferase
MQQAMGVRLASQISAFRAFRADLRSAFETYSGPYVSLDVLLSWGSSKFGGVTVEHAPRREGHSNYTFRKLVVFALDMTTGFSAWPLRAASAVGFFFTLFGGAIMLYVLFRYVLHGSSVPGFPFLASIASLFAGAQLFALGVMGEYLARLHFRSMGRPPSVVRSELEGGRWPAGQEIE